MAYNNRGNYGNQRGGNSQNSRGGNRGGGNYSGGGYNRGGNRNGGYGGRGGNRGGNLDNKYVRSSAFTKFVVDDRSKHREELFLNPGETEEISIALTADKTQDFLKKIEDAINDQQGDGGIRMTFYCQHKENPNSGEEFDGASILVVGKFPARGGNQRGGGGNSRGGGNQRSGRRDYPDRQETDEQYANRTQDDGYREDGRDADHADSQGQSDGNSGGSEQGYTEEPRW